MFPELVCFLAHFGVPLYLVFATMLCVGAIYGEERSLIRDFFWIQQVGIISQKLGFPHSSLL